MLINQTISLVMHHYLCINKMAKITPASKLWRILKKETEEN